MCPNLIFIWKSAKILIVTVILLCISSSYCAVYAEDNRDETVSFVFAGHIRGPYNFILNSLLPQFVRDIEGVNKDFVVIGGDTICGYVTAYDEKGLNREWDMVDAYLNEIDVPVYRVLGNHDFHSQATKTVFNDRYGPEYYSFQKGNTLFIVLNTTRYCPDTSLDWKEIWKSNAFLPNIAEIPEGKQWDFFISKLNEASLDSRIENVVIFMSGLLWAYDETSAEWWSKVHPVLVDNGKVKIVISGESVSSIEDIRIERDGILYLSNSWGITEKDDFSLKGTYLQVIFSNKENSPEVFTRFIGLTPDFYKVLMKSIPQDLHRHMEETVKNIKGEDQSALNRVRMFVRNWMDKQIRLYDRYNNLVVVLVVFILAALVIFSVLLRFFIK